MKPHDTAVLTHKRYRKHKICRMMVTSREKIKLPITRCFFKPIKVGLIKEHSSKLAYLPKWTGHAIFTVRFKHSLCTLHAICIQMVKDLVNDSLSGRVSFACESKSVHFLMFPPLYFSKRNNFCDSLFSAPPLISKNLVLGE